MSEPGKLEKYINETCRRDLKTLAALWDQMRAARDANNHHEGMKLIDAGQAITDRLFIDGVFFSLFMTFEIEEGARWRRDEEKRSDESSEIVTGSIRGGSDRAYLADDTCACGGCSDPAVLATRPDDAAGE